MKGAPMYRRGDLNKTMTPEEHAEMDYVAGLVGKIVAVIEEYEAENAGKILDPKRVKDLNRSAIGQAYDWSKGEYYRDRGK